MPYAAAPARFLAPAWALVAIATAGPVAAFEFSYGEATGTLTTKVTVGAGWRVESRDEGLLGKLNVPGQQAICQPDDCISLNGNPEPNDRLRAARGGHSAHAFDDGNMNYDKGEMISGLSKFSTTLSASQGDWTMKVNYIAFYDAVNQDFRETHHNTELQPRHTDRSRRLEDRVGLRGELREAFVQYKTGLGDREITASLGAQRVRWGEANIHPLNTLDVINPQDAVLPRQPGQSFNELNIPTDLLLITADVIEGVNAEFFYQYDWDAARPEPAGTYFSANDVVGGTYIEAGPGQFAEDPDATYQASVPVSLLSSASRRVPVTESHARNHGQFGLRVNWYVEDFNDGTEFGFYAANYHSRLPYFSIYETEYSCMRRAAIPGNFLAAVAACTNATGIFNGSLQANPSLETEPLPVNTERAELSYPEDIRMFGVSFNTTAFGWSVSGEYSYRPNLPVQVQISDVLFAGAQTAFPTVDTPVVVDGLPGLLGTVIPGARTFIPDYISTYRGRTIENGNEFRPGEFIRGWERLKVGQFVVNALKILPGYLGADEITVLGEGGFTHIVDKPNGIYFQGQAEGTHPGPGADGTGPGTPTTLRLNPTQQTDGFATTFSWGLRALAQMTYNNIGGSALTLKPTILWFEDIHGIAPSPAQNYIEGNRWLTAGAQFQIGQALEGTVLYMYFDGAKNALQDRDNVQVSLSYTF
ncbi:MAG TPA: DUF1302 family protein [Nevskiaceae bacterium]|nr:DUF1302 family protein [Nevskiaceae bacterium]